VWLGTCSRRNIVKPKNILPSTGFPMMPHSGYARLPEGPYLLAEYRASTAMGNDERVVSGGCGRLDGERRRNKGGVRGSSEFEVNAFVTRFGVAALRNPRQCRGSALAHLQAKGASILFAVRPIANTLQSASLIFFFHLAESCQNQVLRRSRDQCFSRSQNKGPATG
jgi:hypothetical protein